MEARPQLGEDAGFPYISTGHLPTPEQVSALVAEAYTRHKDTPKAKFRRSIRPWPGCRAICSASAWSAPAATSTRSETPIIQFSIMSVSKPFVFALVCEIARPGGGAREDRREQHRAAVQFARGGRTERRRPDEPDGECRRDRDDEPGAGCTADARWQFIHDGPVAVRGPAAAAQRRGLRVGVAKPTSATAASPSCCRAAAAIYCDPAEATDLYTRQCSLNVSARDLAVMGATLADGGVNPVTKERVVDAGRLPLRAGGHGDRRACTRPPATGSTTSGCPARAASAAASSPSRPARAGSAPSRRRSTRRQQRQGAARRANILSQRLGMDLFVSTAG